MKQKVLMKGNDACAEAAVIAGCRFYFGYPITPQNEIPAYMARRLPQVGGTFLQAESELAAVSMVMGASAGGARVMTSSASPGMALKQEGISYLSGAELPAVVVNMSRGGPGLGGIAGSQADYYMATRGGGNGDYRTVVLAPHNVQELADLTVQAFDIADRYRVVVLILGDGYLAQMSEALVLPEPTGRSFEKPWAVTGAKDREPQFVASLRLMPMSSLEDHNRHLQDTYRKITEAEVRYDTEDMDDAEYVLVAYGTSARICRKAIGLLRKKGHKVGLFRPITLWPFPEKALLEISKGKKKVLAVEMSEGQMIDDVRMALQGEAEIDFYGRSGGMLPEVEEIVERIESYGS